MSVDARASGSMERQEETACCQSQNQYIWSFGQLGISAEIKGKMVKLNHWHGGDYSLWV